MGTSVEFLKSVKLFSLLDDAELTTLKSTLPSLKAPAGQHLFKEGEEGESLFIVESGQVEISVDNYSGEKVVLATVGATEIFGETSLFDPGPRSASATAIEDATLLIWNRDDLLSFLKTTPAASIDLLAILSRRLREADHLLMDRSTSNPNVVIESKLSALQKCANWIADFSGSMPFLLINAAIFLAWIVINIEMVPGLGAFDPYPFGFLTMSVSLEAIFLSIVVLLSQNLHSAKERIRNDIEYKVNLKAEREVTELHKRLSKLHTELSRKLSRLEERLRAA